MVPEKMKEFDLDSPLIPLKWHCPPCSEESLCMVSLPCPSLKWQISQAVKDINSAHLHRKAEVTSTLSHQLRCSRAEDLCDISEIWKEKNKAKKTTSALFCPARSCLSTQTSHVQPWGRPRPTVPVGGCRLTDTEETERHTRRGTCRYANAAAAIRHHIDTTLPTQLSTQGTASGFFSLPQPAFIFHTTGNWTLSSVIGFLGCRAYLCMRNWMQHFLLWAGLQWWTTESHLKICCW